ncbi:MAG: hypothetical protein M3Y56_04585 [Armatimonadota bacterium]|nr:hypothetical protein [Armatimonadota bacterium]
MKSTHRRILFASVVFVGAYFLYNSIHDRWDSRGQNGTLLSELQSVKSVEIDYASDVEGWNYLYSDSFNLLGYYPLKRLGHGVAELYESDYPVGYRHPERDRRMLALLRQCSGLHSSPPTPQEHGGFVIETHSRTRNHEVNYQSTPHYAYISNTGELGRGHEWVYVPKEFKEWMDSLKPVRPAPPKFTGITVEMPPPPPWAGYVYWFALPVLCILVICLAWLREKPNQPTP